MTPAKTTNKPKSFDQLRKQIDADPARRANVEQHKAAMLGELRRRRTRVLPASATKQPRNPKTKKARNTAAANDA